MTAPIIPGAEPWSADGGPNGALVLHGFTGNPNSMRGIAEALAAAGFAVELPLLPGHGTSVQDMIRMDATALGLGRGFARHKVAHVDSHFVVSPRDESWVLGGFDRDRTLGSVFPEPTTALKLRDQLVIRDAVPV